MSSYTYRISKYEVTNDQYVEFLNAVDPMGSDPNGVYSSYHGADARGGIAFTTVSRQRRRSIPPRPTREISLSTTCRFLTAMRFVNWLENGQGWERHGEWRLHHRRRSE